MLRSYSGGQVDLTHYAYLVSPVDLAEETQFLCAAYVIPFVCRPNFNTVLGSTVIVGFFRVPVAVDNGFVAGCIVRIRSPYECICVFALPCCPHACACIPISGLA